MFEEAFKNELRSINRAEFLVDRLWNEVKSAYTGRNRHYHNLAHLDKIISEIMPVRAAIGDWQTIVLSVAYHDVVYDTRKQNNEEKSANLACTRLLEHGLSQIRAEKCRQQILATKDHRASDDADTNYFSDADLSILGQDEHSYSAYVAGIRKEYSFYPDFLYRPGRRKVLEAFLNRNTIFITSYFREKYEEQSRANIAAEFRSL